MPRIDSTYFGSIIIDGKKFDSDMTICWDGEIQHRPSSHNFTKEELHDILMKDPEIVIVGTGTGGLMKVDPAAEVLAKLKGVELIQKLSMQAAEEFNKLSRKKKVIAVIHVTC